MTRTIIYPTKGAARDAAQAADDVPTKLLKYIPAEVIAFYVPVYAMAPDTPRDGGRWTIFLISIAATVGYLLIRSEPGKPPRPWFYVLAAIAFVLWAIGTTTVGVDLLTLPAWFGTASIPIAILLIPLIDEILTRING